MGHHRKDCISFLMTTSCNLACEYCYLRNCRTSHQSIDLEFAEQGLIDYFSNSPSRHIRFFASGEPTLELAKIKAIRDFAADVADRSIISEIQTNGFFAPEAAIWLAQHMDIIWLSWDGPPDVQDLLRPTPQGQPSSGVLERNARILLEQGRKLTVGVRATITPVNLNRQAEMLEYFRRHGIRAVYSDPVFPPVFPPVGVTGDRIPRPRLDLDESFMMDYAHEFLRTQKRAHELGMFYGSILTVNFDEESEYFCRSCLPSPHLTSDGYVTCCDMASSGDLLPELVYGQYDTELGKIIYDEKKLARIRLRRASNLVECQGCNVLLHCAGACFGEGVNETGRLLGVKQDYCDAIRFLAGHLPLNAGLYPYLHP